MDGGEAGSLWVVPEMETTERLWRGHREASLLRYKEKRQNRLFSKRIRYQVRKLNAEKRPRIKVSFPYLTLSITHNIPVLFPILNLIYDITTILFLYYKPLSIPRILFMM